MRKSCHLASALVVMLTCLFLPCYTTAELFSHDWAAKQTWHGSFSHAASPSGHHLSQQPPFLFSSCPFGAGTFLLVPYTSRKGSTAHTTHGMLVVGVY